MAGGGGACPLVSVSNCSASVILQNEKATQWWGRGGFSMLGNGGCEEFWKARAPWQKLPRSGLSASCPSPPSACSAASSSVHGVKFSREVGMEDKFDDGGLMLGSAFSVDAAGTGTNPEASKATGSPSVGSTAMRGIAGHSLTCDGDVCRYNETRGHQIKASNGRGANGMLKSF